MSFAKIKAFNEEGKMLNKVFVLESVKREGFLIVVDYDDLGQNVMYFLVLPFNILTFISKNWGEMKESMNEESSK